MGKKVKRGFGIGGAFLGVLGLGLLLFAGFLFYNAVGQYKSLDNLAADISNRVGMGSSGKQAEQDTAPVKTASPSKPMASFQTRSAIRGQISRDEPSRERRGLGRFDEQIKKMQTIPLAYNHPKQMYLGRKTQVTLSLKTGAGDHLKALEGTSGDISEATTKVSSIMVAQLDGPNFDVTPSGPQRKLLTSAAPASWTWYVTPKRPGANQALNLELSAVLEEGGRMLPPVTLQTFRAKIEVEVRWWDRALYYIATFDPLYQLLGAIGALASAGLFLRGVWARWKADKEAV